MAARAESLKGHRVLIEALARLKDQPDWTCWLVGGAQRPAEATYLESLVQLVHRLRLTDRVRFLGARDDAREVIAASDVYCQPNIEPEAFRLVADRGDVRAACRSSTSAARWCAGNRGRHLRRADSSRRRAGCRRRAGTVDRRSRAPRCARRRRTSAARAPCVRRTCSCRTSSACSRRPRGRGPRPWTERMPAKPFARLRLAMLSYGLPVEGQKRGGIERVAHTLARRSRRARPRRRGVHPRSEAGSAPPTRSASCRGSAFVNTWLGRRLTMGYLGNVLALVPDYREFDAVIAHGDSLLLAAAGKPVLRVMHGSALGEARSATSWGRWLLQLGVYGQELVTARAPARRRRREREHDGATIRFVAQRHSARRRRQRLPRRGRTRRPPHPSVLFVGTLDGRKRGRFLLDAFERTDPRRASDRDAHHRRQARVRRVPA